MGFGGVPARARWPPCAQPCALPPNPIARGLRRPFLRSAVPRQGWRGIWRAASGAWGAAVGRACRPPPPTRRAGVPPARHGRADARPTQKKSADTISGLSNEKSVTLRHEHWQQRGACCSSPYACQYQPNGIGQYLQHDNPPRCTDFCIDSRMEVIESAAALIGVGCTTQGCVRSTY